MYLLHYYSMPQTLCQPEAGLGREKEDKEMDNITVYMQGIYDKFQKEIHTMYVKEDIIYKIKEVQKQEGRSGFYSRFGELEQMCEAYGISAEEVYRQPERREELLRPVPSRKKLKRILLSQLHEMYREYPMSSQYMERLVRRLAPEFKEDSVRLAILKQFVKYTDYRVGSLENGMKESFTEEEMQRYDSMTKGEKREFLLSKLTDDMFDEILENAENLTDREWAEFMLQKGQMLGLFEQEKFQEVKDWLEKISLEKQGEDPSVWEQLEAIEKKMRTELSCMSYQKKNGTLGTKLEQYRQAKKDKIGAKKEKAKLFRLADELAKGKFYTNGKTRESLYLFALAFQMTACLDEVWDRYDDKSDFEKNLLFDYYNDNLLRYVLDKEYLSHSADYETEPVGEGINYKNYVEMIYLYYIYRQDLKLTPAERIKKAQKLIRSCEKEAKNREDKLTEPKKSLTRVYKKNYMDRFLSLDKEKDLVDYICENYYIIPQEDSFQSKVLLASEQNTVREHQRQLIRELQEIVEDDSFGMDAHLLVEEFTQWLKKQKNYEEIKKAGDWELLVSGLEKWEKEYKKLEEYFGIKLRMRQEELKRRLGEGDEPTGSDAGRNLKKMLADLERWVREQKKLDDYEVGMDLNFLFAECENWKKEGKKLDEEDQKLVELVDSFEEEFKTLMIKLGEKLRIRKNGIFDPKEDILEKKQFSRTELITVCAACFQYELDDLDTYSVPELFEEFCEKANPHLEECRFQKISVKNIFDMYVFFSLILGMIY